MSLQPAKIEADLFFEKKFTFCTLVTRFDEYIEMVESAKKAGFDDDIEYIYFDNEESNQFDGYSGINRALKVAQGEYLIFCHQDILFNYDQRPQLEKCLHELEGKDPNWVIAGNTGKGPYGEPASRITDPNTPNNDTKNLPLLVESLDENFLIINCKHQLAASSAALTGFHLYALDLCQNAKLIGLTSYVIDFHLFHKSGGNVGEDYFKAQDKYTELLRKRRQFAYLPAVCIAFFATPFMCLNRLNKNPKAIKYFRSIIKRLDKFSF